MSNGATLGKGKKKLKASTAESSVLGRKKHVELRKLGKGCWRKKRVSKRLSGSLGLTSWKDKLWKGAQEHLEGLNFEAPRREKRTES